MNVGATVVQAILSGILLCAPASILKKERLFVSLGLAFFAIFGSCKLAGIFLAVPVAIILVLYFIWVRFLARAASGPKHVLFWTTATFAGLYLATQVIHLPVRLALGQPAVLIVANVVGIVWALCMFVMPLEFAIVRRLRPSASLSLQVVGDLDPNSSASHGESSTSTATLPPQKASEEECPYCERMVQPDSDGRCPACHRPIV